MSARSGLCRAIFRGLLLGSVATLIVHGLYVACLPNLHVIIPGQAYRSAQLSGDTLTKVVRNLGIRTVINLRGCCQGRDWYDEECRATSRLGISQEDVSFSAGHLPAVVEVRRLVEVIERSEPPILFHCFRGVDRTGLATVLLLLLKTDTPVPEARRSSGLRYVHLSFGRTGHLDRFLDGYDSWLVGQGGTTHSPARFRHWVMNEYRGDVCAGRIELLGVLYRGADEVKLETTEEQTLLPNVRQRVRVRSDVAFGLRFRLHNGSDRPWRFHPSDNVGIHPIWRMTQENGVPGPSSRFGRLHAVVAPGESIDVTAPMSPLGKDARLNIEIGMVDEQHCMFHEVNLPLLKLELEGS